jgi:hypothetical protein
MSENDKLLKIAVNNKDVVLSKLRRNLEAIDALVKRGIAVKDQCRLSQPYVPGGKPESKRKKGQEATKSAFSR